MAFLALPSKWCVSCVAWLPGREFLLLGLLLPLRKRRRILEL